VRRAAAALLLSAACSGPLPRDPPPRAPEPTLAGRLPKREELVCFQCHSLVKFKKGPRFAHALPAHQKAGHCHLCHGLGHGQDQVAREACLGCHAAGGPELALLPSGDR
jgi:hypothetical protein